MFGSLSTLLVISSLASSAFAQYPYYYRRHRLAGGVIAGIVVGEYAPSFVLIPREKGNNIDLDLLQLLSQASYYVSYFLCSYAVVDYAEGQ